jgi:hypothetical protein
VELLLVMAAETGAAAAPGEGLFLMLAAAAVPVAIAALVAPGVLLLAALRGPVLLVPAEVEAGVEPAEPETPLVPAEASAYLAREPAAMVERDRPMMALAALVDLGAAMPLKQAQLLQATFIAQVTYLDLGFMVAADAGLITLLPNRPTAAVGQSASFGDPTGLSPTSTLTTCNHHAKY